MVVQNKVRVGMEIEPEELRILKVSLDYMENAMTDVVGWANDPNTKLKFMHECKRIHAIAMGEIDKVYERDRKDKR